MQQWGRDYIPWLLVAAAIVGAVAAGIGVMDLVNVSNKASEVSSAFARASAGVGLYVVIAGGVLAIVGALTGKRAVGVAKS